MSEAGAKTSMKLNPKKAVSDFVSKEVAHTLGLRANENTEEAIKAREAAAYLAEYMNKEALRKEEGEANDEASDSGEEESEDEEGFAISNRDGFGMQDILDAAAKLPTQKQPDELVTGAQQTIHTEEQKEEFTRMLKMVKENLVREQQAKLEASTTNEGSSKLTTPEKKPKKNKVLSKTSSSSKPKLEKDKPVPAIKKDIPLTIETGQQQPALD